MKSKDLSTATSLLIQGYLRANSAGTRPEAAELSDCINAIRSECDDWSENLDGGSGALEPSALSVDVHEMNGCPISRTPYNLISAAVALVSEAFDLNGPMVIGDLVSRLQAYRDGKKPIPGSAAILVEAANCLSSDIDVSVDRPHAMLGTFDLLVAELRARNVNVEDAVCCPSNWG